MWEARRAGFVVALSSMREAQHATSLLALQRTNSHPTPQREFFFFFEADDLSTAKKNFFKVSM